MTERIPISQEDILNNNYSFEEKYIFEDSDEDEHTLAITHDSNWFTKHFEIDLFIPNDLYFEDLENLESISENIIVGEEFFIDECPLLKELPLKTTFEKSINFYNNQHLITIFSEEQFKSLKCIKIWSEDFKPIQIKTYEEYYSLIEPTLIKNNLMKICNF